MDNLTRQNRGEYVVQAVNDLGCAKCSTFLTIVSRPSEPSNLSVEWRRSGVLISWLKPEDDGGSEVTKYIVEYFRQGWDLWLTLIGSNEEAVFIQNLIENSRYKFRVKAENFYGISEPSIETDWVHVTFSESTFSLVYFFAIFCNQ